MNSNIVLNADVEYWRGVVGSLIGKKDSADEEEFFLSMKGFFDSKYYLSNNKDVVKAKMDPLKHFILFGCREDRSPNASFDPVYYRKKYGADFGESDVPVIHYLSTGRGLGYFGNLVSQRIGDSAVEGKVLEKIGSLAFLEIFDHEYYNALYLNRSSGALFSEGVSHFIEYGFDNTFELSERWVFDPRFYIAQYSDVIGLKLSLSDRLDLWLDVGSGGLEDGHYQIAYSHFLKIGYAAGLTPNLARYIEVKYGVNLEMYYSKLLKNEIISILAVRGDALPSEYLDEIFLGDDFGFFMSIRDVSSNTHKLISTIADHHAKRGCDKGAELIYGVLRSISPNDSKMNLRHADVLQRMGCEGSALALRNEAKGDGFKDEWMYLNLSDAYAKSNAYFASAANNAAVGKEFKSSFYIGKRTRLEGDSLASKAWGSSRRKAKVYGLRYAQDRMSEVLDLVYTSEPSGVPKGIVKSVAIVANQDLPQCKLYRVDQKVEALKLAGFSTRVFSHSTEVPDFIEGLAEFDAVIFYRVAAFPHVCEAIRLARIAGLRTFYEIDDQIFDRDVYPPSYESYAGQITFDEYLGLGVGVPLFRKAMSLCEFGIASTPTIQKAMAKVVESGRVFLHRNAIGSIHECAVDYDVVDKKGFEGPVEIFYGSGTRAHREIIYEIIGPVFKKLAKEFGDKVSFRIVGYIDRSQGDFADLGDSLTVVEPVWDIEEYWEQLNGCDINLAVLEASELTDGKSEIKWMEAAMFGIPSVVTPTKTYREVLADGENVLFASTKAKFFKQLKLLIGDAGLRQKIGDKAKRFAVENYSPEVQASSLTSIMGDGDCSVRVTKKRLLVVNVFYAPQSIGGATRVVEDNVRELKLQYGHEYDIEVVCTMLGADKDYEVYTYINDGVRVHAIGAPNYQNVDQAPQDHLMGRAFEKILETVDPHLVHFHCIQRLTASVVNVTRRKRIPYVITIHDGWWFSPNQFLIGPDDAVEVYDYSLGVELMPKRARSLRKALIGAEKLLPVSKAFGDIVVAAGLKNVLSIANGVSAISPGGRKSRTEGRVRLAHIGGNSRHKGIHLVKNALMSHDFDNLHLTLIDHSFGSTEEVLTYWGSTPVTIRGKYLSSDVADLYAQVDVLLAPSIWPESYGLVTREALSCGCWAVASDLGAIGECIDSGKNGFIVNTSDHLDLQKVLKLIDKAPRKYLRSPRRKVSLRKSKEQAVDLMDLYRTLV